MLLLIFRNKMIKITINHLKQQINLNKILKNKINKKKINLKMKI